MRKRKQGTFVTGFGFGTTCMKKRHKKEITMTGHRYNGGKDLLQMYWRA